MKPIRLNELNPKTLKAIVSEKPLILVPIGTTEWHADHLPLGVDSLLSQATCDEVSAQNGCVVAPLLSCGISRNLKPEKGYYGTVDTIGKETLTSLIKELLDGYAKMGFITAVLFTGHGETEHWEAINQAIKTSKNIKAIMLSAYEFSKNVIQDLDDVEKTWPYALDHAAEWETSMMLHYHPELVHMENAPETVELDIPGIPAYIHKRYPRRASRAYGRKLATAVTAGGVKMIAEILHERNV
ncbi:MAG: creatininase family protein [Pelolinea sp.]|nr:creatininase family protein [Pelolinea sp.]